MAISIKHPTPGDGKVNQDDYNADHLITGTPNRILGTDDAGNAVELDIDPAAAASAASDAGLYAAAAQAFADGLYATTADGLAAVAEGGYFLVAGAGDAFATLYRDVAGAAVAQNIEIPSLAGIDAITSFFGTDSFTGEDLSFTDGDGNVVGGIQDDGSWRFGTVDVDAITVGGQPIGASASAPFAGEGNFPANVAHIVSYGQSLSIGVNASPVLTTTQRFDNLRFSGGVRSQDSGTPYTSLVPLTETVSTVYGETPLGGVTDSIKELITAEDGIAYTQQSFQLLGSAPGEGGVPIGGFINTQPFYARLMADVNAGLSLSAAAGKSYKALSVLWLQGESDEGNTNYSSILQGLYGTLNTDIKGVTGQTEDIAMLCYDSPITDVVLRMQNAANAVAGIHIVGPIYQLALSDGTHFTAQSSKHWGAQAGKVFKRIVIDGADWLPTSPASTFRQGKIAEVKFNVPVGPLVFDTTTLADQTNKGFRLFQADGTTAMTISSVTITQPDTVRIVASATIPAGAVLRYGFTDTSVHARVFGGNLRDSDPTIFDGDGLDLPLHNWCVCFERAL